MCLYTFTFILLYVNFKQKLPIVMNVFLITTLLRVSAPHISNEILLKSILHQFTLCVSMYRNTYVCSCVLAVRVCRSEDNLKGHSLGTFLLLFQTGSLIVLDVSQVIQASMSHLTIAMHQAFSMSSGNLNSGPHNCKDLTD